MAIDPDDISTYTDAEIVKALRAALVNTAVARQYSLNGRSLEHWSPEEINKVLVIFETRVANASGGRGTTATVKFGRPQ